MRALSKRNDETDLQWRSRLAASKALGDARDVINPFRLQHHDFDDEFIQHYETGTKTQARKIKCRIAEQFNDGKLTKDEASALIRYKQAWDVRDRSPAKSSIDFSVGGDGDGMLTYLDSARHLYQWQKEIGKHCKLAIFESVVCQGKSFRQTAVDIHGYANQRTSDDVQNHYMRGVAACLKVVE